MAKGLSNITEVYQVSLEVMVEGSMQAQVKYHVRRREHQRLDASDPGGLRPPPHLIDVYTERADRGSQAVMQVDWHPHIRAHQRREMMPPPPSRPGAEGNVVQSPQVPVGRGQLPLPYQEIEVIHRTEPDIAIELLRERSSFEHHHLDPLTM